MKRAIAVAVLCTVTPFVSGCGIIFGGTRQNISATSSPAGAAIKLMPASVDYTTPTSLHLERKNDYTVNFSMTGYTSQSAQIEKNLRVGIVVADVLLTGLIGVVIDAATGAWYRLSPENVNVSLSKTSASVEGPETITVTLRTHDEGDKRSVRVESSVPGVSVWAVAH